MRSWPLMRAYEWSVELMSAQVLHSKINKKCEVFKWHLSQFSPNNTKVDIFKVYTERAVERKPRNLPTILTTSTTVTTTILILVHIHQETNIKMFHNSLAEIIKDKGNLWLNILAPRASEKFHNIILCCKYEKKERKCFHIGEIL